MNTIIGNQYDIFIIYEYFIPLKQFKCRLKKKMIMINYTFFIYNHNYVCSM